MLVEESAGRSLKDTRPAGRGQYLQITDLEEEFAESPEHVLDHHRVQSWSRLGGKNFMSS